MISYTLRCDDGHEVASWFASAAAYDALEKAGHLSCGVCGSSEVRKSLMAPRLSQDVTGNAETAHNVPILRGPSSEIEKAVAELRARVEANSDYVGGDFVSTARAMHAGEVPERSIWGEARIDQARKLAEDGVPLVPLPFRPKQKLT